MPNLNQNSIAILAAIARAIIRCEGMKAENQSWILAGQSPVYGIGHFNSLIDEEGIGSNTVIQNLS